MDRVGSVEFGDWLVHELMKARLLVSPHSRLDRQKSSVRIAMLQSAERLLIEFLLLQEKMLGEPLG